MKQAKRQTNKQTSLKRTNFQRTRSGEHLFDHVTRTKMGTVGSAVRDNKLSLTPSILATLPWSLKSHFPKKRFNLPKKSGKYPLKKCKTFFFVCSSPLLISQSTLPKQVQMSLSIWEGSDKIAKHQPTKSRGDPHFLII